jgi:glycosyltransferase involved in cell wall biosynthesis
VSSAHVYLTHPFVLSWSFMEAMAAGCLIVGSATAPVEEVIRHGVNGLLTDFHSPDIIASSLADALAIGGAADAIRARARQTVLDRYELQGCLARQNALIQDVTR